MALVKSKYIDLSAAPWTMHDFFAGSGLVGYAIKNDIPGYSEKKITLYKMMF